MDCLDANTMTIGDADNLHCSTCVALWLEMKKECILGHTLPNLKDKKNFTFHKFLD